MQDESPVEEALQAQLPSLALLLAVGLPASQLMLQAHSLSDLRRAGSSQAACDWSTVRPCTIGARCAADTEAVLEVAQTVRRARACLRAAQDCQQSQDASRLG